ncbi:MAG: hypothetical protein JSR60_19230 [Proteobacteria bacterium]|nr:hypothetical protein [Pseudomonadota bacterium]
MTLQISEIGIRLSVSDGATQSAATGGSAIPSNAAGAHQPAPQVEEIVQQCVRRVLESLRMHEAR